MNTKKAIEIVKKVYSYTKCYVHIKQDISTYRNDTTLNINYTLYNSKLLFSNHTSCFSKNHSSLNSLIEEVNKTMSTTYNDWKPIKLIKTNNRNTNIE